MECHTHLVNNTEKPQTSMIHLRRNIAVRFVRHCRFGQFMVSTLPAGLVNEKDVSLDAPWTSDGSADEAVSPRVVSLRNVMLELILCLIYGESGQLDNRSAPVRHIHEHSFTFTSARPVVLPRDLSFCLAPRLFSGPVVLSRDASFVSRALWFCFVFCFFLTSFSRVPSFVSGILSFLFLFLSGARLSFSFSRPVVLYVCCFHDQVTCLLCFSFRFLNTGRHQHDFLVT